MHGKESHLGNDEHVGDKDQVGIALPLRGEIVPVRAVPVLPRSVDIAPLGESGRIVPFAKQAKEPFIEAQVLLRVGIVVPPHHHALSELRLHPRFDERAVGQALGEPFRYVLVCSVTRSGLQTLGYELQEFGLLDLSSGLHHAGPLRPIVAQDIVPGDAALGYLHDLDGVLAVGPILHSVPHQQQRVQPRTGWIAVAGRRHVDSGAQACPVQPGYATNHARSGLADKRLSLARPGIDGILNEQAGCVLERASGGEHEIPTQKVAVPLGGWPGHGEPVAQNGNRQLLGLGGKGCGCTEGHVARVDV